jgi:hypothetical protein
MTTKTTTLVDKRRVEFGLTPLETYPVDELDKILRGDAP